MRLNTLADKLRSRTKDEVSFHAFPHQMELIRALPHVSAGAGDGVLLPAGVVGRRAGILNLAHIGLTIKYPQRWLLRMRWHRCKGYEPRKRQGRDEAVGSSSHLCLPFAVVW